MLNVLRIVGNARRIEIIKLTFNALNVWMAINLIKVNAEKNVSKTVKFAKTKGHLNV